MSENSETIREKRIKNLKPFKPGQSGNPGGRPKGTLKQYVQKMFQEMPEKEKAQWLKVQRVSGIDIWKMGEGLPKQDVELSGEITKKIISVEE